MTDAQFWAVGPMIAFALVVLFVILFYRTVVRLFGVVIVPEDSAGIVNKKYALVGQHRTLPPGAIASMDSGNYAGIEISKALAGSGFKLVPDVVVNGGGSGSTDGGNSLVSVLLANLIRDGRGKRTDGEP